MLGNWRWNVWVGSAAALITFMLSVNHNIWTTAGLSAFYAFVLVYALLFFIRWVLALLTPNLLIQPMNNNLDEGVGTAVNMVTPEDDVELQKLINPNNESAEDLFQLINPPKLKSNFDQADPNELANALRRLTEE